MTASEIVGAIAALASAVAASAAWAAVRVANRAAREDRQRRDLADLQTLHEELLAVRAMLENTESVNPDQVELAFRRLNRSTIGHPPHEFVTALGQLDQLRRSFSIGLDDPTPWLDPDQRDATANAVVAALAGVEKALRTARLESKPSQPRWWQLRRRWRVRGRRVRGS